MVLLWVGLRVGVVGCLWSVFEFVEELVVVVLVGVGWGFE
jgi:hypothetical protein